MSYGWSDGVTDIYDALRGAGVPMRKPEDEESVVEAVDCAMEVVDILGEALAALKLLVDSMETPRSEKGTAAWDAARAVLAKINDAKLSRE